MGKNLPASTGDTRDAGAIPGQEGPLGKETAARSSVLAWKIPWSERLNTHTHTHRLVKQGSVLMGG